MIGFAPGESFRCWSPPSDSGLASQIFFQMLSVELHSACQGVGQCDLRLPAQSRPDPTEIRVVVPDVDWLPVGRIRADDVLAAPVCLHEGFGEVPETHNPIAAQIKNFSISFVACRS